MSLLSFTLWVESSWHNSIRGIRHRDHLVTPLAMPLDLGLAWGPLQVYSTSDGHMTDPVSWVVDESVCPQPLYGQACTNLPYFTKLAVREPTTTVGVVQLENRPSVSGD